MSNNHVYRICCICGKRHGSTVGYKTVLAAAGFKDRGFGDDKAVRECVKAFLMSKGLSPSHAEQQTAEEDDRERKLRVLTGSAFGKRVIAKRITEELGFADEDPSDMSEENKEKLRQNELEIAEAVRSGKGLSEIFKQPKREI